MCCPRPLYLRPPTRKRPLMRTNVFPTIKAPAVVSPDLSPYTAPPGVGLYFAPSPTNPSCPLPRQTISSRSEGRLKPSPNREDIMDDTIITVYCLCDEFLKAIHHEDDPQVRLTTAEVMTVPLVAAAFFGADIDKTRRFLHEYGYMKEMISKSRFD